MQDHKGIGYDFQPYGFCLLSVNEWMWLEKQQTKEDLK